MSVEHESHDQLCCTEDDENWWGFFTTKKLASGFNLKINYCRSQYLQYFVCVEYCNATRMS
jgi:hypothetical protein